MCSTAQARVQRCWWSGWGTRRGNTSGGTEAKGEGEYKVTLVALSERPMTLKMIDGVPRLVETLNGRPAILHKIYVATKESWIG